MTDDEQSEALASVDCVNLSRTSPFITADRLQVQ